MCAAGLLIQFCNMGLVATSFGIFMPLIRESIGLSNTQLSVMMSLRSLMGLTATMLAGRYYKKLSFRTAVLLMSLLIPAGMFLLFRAESAWPCYLAISLMGISFGAGAVIPVARLMRNWFGQDSASAIAICATGSSLASIIVPVIVTSLTERFGLSTAFLTLVIFTGICAAAEWLVIREFPESGGSIPVSAAVSAGPAGKSVFRMPESGWRCLLAVCFLLGASGTISNANLSVHLVTEGYTAMQAAHAMSLFGAFLLAGKLFFSAGNKKVGTDRMSYLLLGLFAVSCFLFTVTGSVSVPLMVIASVLFGLGSVPGSVGTSCWTGDFSDGEEYNDRLRHNQTLFFIGALVTTPFPGILADRTGSYNSSFLACALMGAVMLVILWMLYRKRSRVIRMMSDQTDETAG